MNFEKFKNMKRFAEILNINTAQELLAFKADINARSNDALYFGLYTAALFTLYKQRNAPQC